MDDSELMDEVLELTLACQRGDATPEEHARLERLLADNPSAILWYLRIVDDTLTLLDDAAAKGNPAATAGGSTGSPGDEPVAPQKQTASPAARLKHSWLA